MEENNKLIENKEELLKSLREKGESYDLITEGFIFPDEKTRNEMQIELDLGDFKYASDELKSDPEVVLEAIKYSNGRAFELANKELKNDREFALKAVKVHPQTLKYMKEEFKNDKEIVLASVKNYGAMLKLASKELKSDREIILAAVKSRGYILNEVEEYNNDFEIVLEAVKSYRYALKYASEELRNNKEIVMSAINNTKEYCYAKQFVNVFGSVETRTTGLLEDYIIRNEFLENSILDFVNKEFLNDKEVMLEAIKNWSYGLKPAINYTDLKNDREFCLEAVKLNGLILEYLNDKFKNDKEIVFEAVKTNGNAYKYASKHLKSDKSLALLAVKTPGSIEFIDEELKNDIEVAKTSMKYYGDSYAYLSDELKSNREIILTGAQSTGLYLENLSEELKSDREIVLETVKHDGLELEYANKKFLNDEEIVDEALKNWDVRNLLKKSNPNIKYKIKIVNRLIDKIKEKVQNDTLTKQEAINYIKEHAWFFELISEKFRKDKEVIIEAVKVNLDVLANIELEQKNDEELFKELLKINRLAIIYMIDEEKRDRLFRYLRDI